MVKRLSADARRAVLTSAAGETQRRGDRRIGTEHLLLGVLHDPGSEVAQALGVDLGSARAASATLDRDALAAVGVDVDVEHLGPLSNVDGPHRRPPLTSGARAVLQRSLHEARSVRSRSIETRHLLLALLARERPGPAAELLAALRVDPAAVRERLGASSGD
jgi:ATP-dependent Clp protease ATP-binding subunit ClpA